MKEITVGKENCDFVTIQEALDAALDGDTIFVKPGIYDGSFRITKPINLIGSKESIMDKSAAELPIVCGNSVKIETDGATIEGIVFEGDCWYADNPFSTGKGFKNLKDYVKKSNRGDGNECYNNNTDSDYLVYVNGKTVLKNVGIYGSYSNGIGFFSRDSEFSDSVIFNCNIGICLGVKGTLSANPKFYNLYVSDCAIGMKSVTQSNPVVYDSLFFRNIIFGIWTINESKGTYSNCKIVGTAHTGIVIDDKSSPVLDSCEIDSNSIGIVCLGNSSLEIKNSHISKTETEYSFKYQQGPDFDFPPLYYLPYYSEDNNFYPSIIGRGIYFYGYECTLKVQNCHFDNNVDGIRFATRVENPVSIENSIFSENENGIFVESLDGSSFNESFVRNCQMFKNGCGISFQDSLNNCVQNCEIYNNKTGIKLLNAENIKISSCKIYSNNEKKRWVSGIKVEHSSAIVENCEIFNHIGVGIRVENRGKLSFSNCNFHDNRVNVEKISTKGVRSSENAPLQNEKIEISAPVVYEDYKRDFDEDDVVEEQKKAAERAREEEEERKRIEFENSPEHQKFLAEQKERKEHEAKVQNECKNLQETAFTKANLEKDFITVTDEITTTGISKNLVSASLFKIYCKQSVNEEDSKKNAKTLKSFVKDFFEFAKNKAGGKYRLPTVSELKLLYEADKTAFAQGSCELTESDECVFLGSDGTLQTKPREGSDEYNFRICKTISVKKIEKPEAEVEKPKPHFDYIYEIDKQNNGVVLKGCKDTSVKEFVIPAEIDGMKVVHIAKDALSNLRCLETLKFELFETKNISSFSLNECSSLKQIQIGDTIKFRIR